MARGASPDVVTARRFLRPTQLVPVGDEIWVFDEFHPVAAVLDRSSGGLRRLVCWPDVEAYQSKLVAGGGRGVWLQTSPGDRLIRLGPDGPEFGVDVGAVRDGSERDPGPGSRRLLATPAGAWSVPLAAGELDTATHRDAPPRNDIRRSLLCFTSVGEVRRAVPVDGRVEWAGTSGGAAYLRVAVAPSHRTDDLEWQARLHPETVIPDHVPRWRMDYRRVWLRLPDDGAALDRVTARDHGAGTPRLPFDDSTTGGVAWRNPWYQQAGRWREKVAGVEWRWGWRPSRDEGIWGRHVWATGRDSTTRVVRRRVDLGAGQVIAAVNDGTALWLSLQRRTAPPLDYPSELLRIDGATGEVTTPVEVGEVDITGTGWPRAPRPADVEEHIRDQRARVVAMVLPGSGSGGLACLCDDVSGVAVDVVGSWPDTAVLVRFRHVGWPGIRLERRLRLFDELGRPAPIDLDLVGWRLDEWLATRLAPPPRDAVGGVLEL